MMMYIAFSLILIIIFSIVLIRAADVLTYHLKCLSEKTAISKLFLSSFIIGIATSIPELFVGVTSAVEQVPSLSFGNVIGSNIANLSIVAGAAALISGSLQIKKTEQYTIDFMYGFFAGIAPILLSFDGMLSNLDGIILILLYGYYNVSILKKEEIQTTEHEPFLERLIHKMKKNHTGKNIKYIFISLIFLLLSSDIIVKASTYTAFQLHIPIFFIGLFVVAVGTSLPELSFAIKSITKHEPELFMGNLLGSIVANTLLIVGITSLIAPIRIFSLSEYSIAGLIFVAVLGVFLLFVRSGKRLARSEGAVLCLIYLLFVILEGIAHY